MNGADTAIDDHVDPDDEDDLDEDHDQAGSSLGEVVATIELTEADYVDAYLGYATHHDQIRSLRKAMGIVLGITAVVVRIGWPVLPGVWTAMVALLVTSFFLVRQQWVFTAKRAFRNLHEKRRRYELRVDARGRVGRGPRAEVRSRWASVSGWLETDRVMVVFSPQGLVDLFPKRAFDEARLVTLRALFDAYIDAPSPSPSPAVEPAKKGGKKGGLSPGVKTLLLWVLLVIGLFVVYQLLTVRP